MTWTKDHKVWAAPYACTTYPTASQLKKYGSVGPYRGSGSPTTLKNAGYAEAASMCGESAWRSITGTARFHAGGAHRRPGLDVVGAEDGLDAPVQ